MFTAGQAQNDFSFVRTLLRKYPWLEKLLPEPAHLSDALLREGATDISAWYREYLSLARIQLARFYPAGRKDLTYRVLDYILANVSHKLTLDMAADACFVNKSYLSHSFKADLGISFVDYINLFRMEWVCNLLRGTHLTLPEIAETTGYGDCKYMTRIFHRMYNMTPTEYRWRSRGGLPE